MTGRAEVSRLKQRLDSTFERVKNGTSDLELQSDFARYLCVLVSGYLEKAAIELVLEHARNAGAPTVQRFVEKRTAHFTNSNTQRLIDLLGSFDPNWQATLQAYVVDDLKDAVDSVVGLRNRIAHGESVGLTYQRVSDYYSRVQKVIDQIADICAPSK
jgi:hypothetical protein